MGIGRQGILMKALANSRCLPLNLPSQTLRKRIRVGLTVVFRVGVVVRPTPQLRRNTAGCWFSRFRTLRVFLCAVGVDWSLLGRTRGLFGDRAGSSLAKGLRWRHGGPVDGFAVGEALPPMRVAIGVPRARRPHRPPSACRWRTGGPTTGRGAIRDLGHHGRWPTGERSALEVEDCQDPR